MTPRTVSRALRLADLSGLLLVVGGAVCYGRAFLGMRQLQHAKPLPMPLPPGSTIFAATAEFSAQARLAYVGLGLVAAGVMVGVGSAMLWRRGRRADEAAAVAPAHAPEPSIAA
jgi:hypothetical protein